MNQKKALLPLLLFALTFSLTACDDDKTTITSITPEVKTDTDKVPPPATPPKEAPTVTIIEAPDPLTAEIDSCMEIMDDASGHSPDVGSEEWLSACRLRKQAKHNPAQTTKKHPLPYPGTLCKRHETPRYACVMENDKLLSFCAIDEKKWVYRFGHSLDQIELELTGNIKKLGVDDLQHPEKQGVFLLKESMYAKGRETTIGFVNGEYQYVFHDDIFPTNTGDAVFHGIQIYKGKGIGVKPIGFLDCNDNTATNVSSIQAAPVSRALSADISARQITRQRLSEKEQQVFDKLEPVIKKYAQGGDTNHSVENIQPETKVSELLDTEHTQMSFKGMLSTDFGLSYKDVEALWEQDPSIADWCKIINQHDQEASRSQAAIQEIPLASDPIDSLCKDEESVQYTCIAKNNKMISFCSIGESRRWVYRYGKDMQHIELAVKGTLTELSVDADLTPRKSGEFLIRNALYSKGGETMIAFKNNGFTYLFADNLTSTPSGEVITHGLSVFKGTKKSARPLAFIQCNDNQGQAPRSLSEN
jgi:hypothetical protein